MSFSTCATGQVFPLKKKFYVIMLRFLGALKNLLNSKMGPLHSSAMSIRARLPACELIIHVSLGKSLFPSGPQFLMGTMGLTTEGC